MPAVPAGLSMNSRTNSTVDKIDEDEVFDSPKSTRKTSRPEKVRRSSLAALRRDSCKIS